MSLTLLKIIKGELPGEQVGECTCCGTPLTKVFVMSDGSRLGHECAKKATEQARRAARYAQVERDNARAEYLSSLRIEARR